MLYTVCLSIVEKEIRFALLAVRGFGGLKQLSLIKLIEKIYFVSENIQHFYDMHEVLTSDVLLLIGIVKQKTVSDLD